MTDPAFVADSAPTPSRKRRWLVTGLYEVMCAFMDWPIHVCLVATQLNTAPIFARHLLARLDRGHSVAYRVATHGCIVLLVYKWVFYKPTLWLLDRVLANDDAPSKAELRTRKWRLDVAAIEGVPQAVNLQLQQQEFALGTMGVVSGWLDQFVTVLDNFGLAALRSVIAHSVAIAGTYPLLLVSTRLALVNDGATVAHCLELLKQLSWRELYAGAQPRVVACIIHAAVAYCTFLMATHTLRQVRRGVQLTALGVAERGWFNSVMPALGITALVSTAGIASYPFNLISARARVGMIEPLAVTTVAGMIEQLKLIVRNESFFALWRGSAIVAAWRLVSLLYSPFAFVSINTNIH
jgi:hypothetical protein